MLISHNTHWEANLLIKLRTTNTFWISEKVRCKHTFITLEKTAFPCNMFNILKMETGALGQISQSALQQMAVGVKQEQELAQTLLLQMVV